jgi:hypothetical protein
VSSHTDEIRRSVEECSRLADLAPDADLRDQFLELAAKFEELAKRIDEKHRRVLAKERP